MRRRDNTILAAELRGVKEALEGIQAAFTTGQQLVLDSVHTAAAEASAAKAEAAIAADKIAGLRKMLEDALMLPPAAPAPPVEAPEAAPEAPAAPKPRARRTAAAKTDGA